jgi:dihydrofolate reductase
MSKVKISGFTISADGFGAGPNQDLQNPLGVGGASLHQWLVGTQSFQDMLGQKGKGSTGPDNDFAEKSMENMGAWIMGRNMFGPIRGAWSDDSWKGWWGENPPYHVPIFVLTHHARPPLKMAGNNTFYFVTDGIRSALDQAKKAANGKDIRIGGGVSTIRQYLQAGLVDEIHFAISPILLGNGENVFAGLNLPALGFTHVEHVSTPKALHLFLS